MPLDLAEVLAFEERWDEALGGPQTRVYREIACYVIKRLMSSGAELGDALVYVRECVETFWPPRQQDGS